MSSLRETAVPNSQPCLFDISSLSFFLSQQEDEHDQKLDKDARRSLLSEARDIGIELKRWKVRTKLQVVSYTAISCPSVSRASFPYSTVSFPSIMLRKKEYDRYKGKKLTRSTKRLNNDGRRSLLSKARDIALELKRWKDEEKYILVPAALKTVSFLSVDSSPAGFFLRGLLFGGFLLLLMSIT